MDGWMDGMTTITSHLVSHLISSRLYHPHSKTSRADVAIVSMHVGCMGGGLVNRGSDGQPLMSLPLWSQPTQRFMPPSQCPFLPFVLFSSQLVFILSSLSSSSPSPSFAVTLLILSSRSPHPNTAGTPTPSPFTPALVQRHASRCQIPFDHYFSSPFRHEA